MNDSIVHPVWRKLLNLGLGVFSAVAGWLMMALLSLVCLHSMCATGPLEGLWLYFPIILFLTSLFVPIWLVQKNISKIQMISTRKGLMAVFILGWINLVVIQVVLPAVMQELSLTYCSPS